MSPKSIAGLGASLVLPACNYASTIFVLGHMRCGSTALSRIICDHPQVSGYGEAHIRYDGRSALGVLALNQMRNSALRPGAARMFDKILHSRYDVDACTSFFEASAVFLVREPGDSIRSIRKLFGKAHTGEYATDAIAADYYEERLQTLGRHWHRFAPERRIGLTYDALTGNTDAALAAISASLGLSPALGNSYAPGERAHGHGAGDTLSAHRFDRIVSSQQSTTLRHECDKVALSDHRISELDRLYLDIARIIVHL